MSQFHFTNLSDPSAYTPSASSGCIAQRATQKNRNAQRIRMPFIGRMMGARARSVKSAGSMP